MACPSAPVRLPAPILPLDRLEESRDGLVLRDASARGGRPALRPLAPLWGGRARSLAIEGPFTALQRFSVTREEGAAFDQASRDENPLHTRANIVPGAMLAARPLLLAELLVPGARVERARIRFRAPARYGAPTVNVYRISPGAGGRLDASVAVRQDGQEVASAQISLATDPLSSAPPDGAPEESPDAAVEESSRVERFLESLRVDPVLLLRRTGPLYPRAYLAALPSGEMVRQFSGEGGLLNVLELEFPEAAPWLRSTIPPVVELRDAERQRRSFRKIMARIAHGVRTWCSGFAMVLPRGAVDLPSA